VPSERPGGTDVKIGILVFPAVEELDFVGPWEMFGMWGLIGSSVRTHLVGQTTEPLRCAKGLTVVPEFSFEDCPPLDVLLVPGGQGTREQVDNPVLMTFVKHQAEQHVQTLMSVCTGAFILHRAGLLLGRRATTHWASLNRLRAAGDVNVVEARWVVDGPVWTSAGVSAGMDMALAYIEQVSGPITAGKVQMAAEYYPEGKLHGGDAMHGKAPSYVRERPAK
jgi:transcriptional regulator GlxA family with amidase domain